MKKIHADVTEGFGKYINKHIEPITNELDEKKKTDIGYGFCPTVESGYKGSADYNVVMDAVNSAKKAVEEIQKNSMAYISKQIEDAPDFMKAIIARFPEEVCNIDMKYTQGKALGVIRRYGSTKFIAETREPLEKLQSEYYTDMKALGEKEKELEKNTFPDLDTDGSAKYFAEVEKEKDELRKREEQIKMLSGITNAIVKEVIGVIQERENASKKATD
ncbi:MAG: hypothetical protein ABIF18_03230 [archaeon]